MNNIATNFCYMRRVYKEDIIGFQSRKSLKWNVLHYIYYYLMLFFVLVAQ
nr:B156 [uncultured bacterium]ART41073.1 L562 [uncultured bacterium]